MSNTKKAPVDGNSLVPANLRPNLKIKAKDQGFPVMEFTRIIVPNNDPKHPIEKRWLKTMRKADYYRYFVDCDTAQQIQYKEAMNIDSAELIHNPELLKEEDKVVLLPRSKSAVSEEKFRRAKKSATIGDIENLLAEKDNK